MLLNPPPGPDQLLFIDGGPASTPTRSYSLIPYKATLLAGQANTLGFTPRLHLQKTTGLVDVSNAAVERVVADPAVPDFEMRIPSGVTITGWDGQPNTEVSIRRVPIDRSPLPPLPAGLNAPSLFMYYFGKPGGGTPSAPVPITFPNDLRLPPGASAHLWYYDEAPDGSRPNQWAQYGTGTVSPDGTQIIPDLDPTTGQPYGQPRFCCGASFAAAPVPPDATTVDQPTASEPTTDGDPVDLATGFFTYSKTDLVLPGPFPIVLTRTYRNGDTFQGPFGLGGRHAFDIFLVPSTPTATDQLVLILRISLIVNTQIAPS